jgi:hypothetical protein
VQRCRLNANDEAPFGCPEHCLFFETRSLTDTGWTREEEVDPPGENRDPPGENRDPPGENRPPPPE